MESRACLLFGLLDLFKTSAIVEATKTKECELELQNWDSLNRDLQKYFCPHLEIYERGYSINLDQNLTVEAFAIRVNKKVKFLPENVGEKFPNLLTFDAWGSAVQSVESRVFKNMSKLFMLNLDFNQIELIKPGSFDGLRRLEFLSLSFNRIEQLDANLFSSLSNLKNLWLNDNRLQKLDENLFQPLRSLQLLHLSRNQIETVGSKLFDPLKSLEVLFLDGNQIETLKQNLLENLFNLQKVSFNSNQLETLHENFLTKNQNLRYIKLSYNRIEALSTKLFEDKKNLKRVDLRGNRCIDSDYWPEVDRMPNAFIKMRSDLVENCHEAAKVSDSNKMLIQGFSG
jgi:Leucine rich repeat/BspA type Leucine rich repeat region (6 copies)